MNMSRMRGLYTWRLITSVGKKRYFKKLQKDHLKSMMLPYLLFLIITAEILPLLCLLCTNFTPQPVPLILMRVLSGKGTIHLKWWWQNPAIHIINSVHCRVFYLCLSNYNTGGIFLTLFESNIVSLYWFVHFWPPVFNHAKGKPNVMENWVHTADQFILLT